MARDPIGITPEIRGRRPKEKTMSEPKADSGEDVPCISLLASAIGLLAVAKCPNCDDCGFTVREIGGCDMDGENDSRECMQEQCQWCYEREMIVSEYKANDGT
jgi:hypothetical protein